MKRIRRTARISYLLLCIVMCLIHIQMMYRITYQTSVQHESSALLSSINPLYVTSSFLFIIASGIGFFGILRLRPTSRNEVEKTVLPLTYTLFLFFTLPTISSALYLETRYFNLERPYIAILFMAFSFFLVTGVFQMGMNSSRVHRFYPFIPLLSFWVASLIPPYTQVTGKGLITSRLPPMILLIALTLSFVTVLTYWGHFLQSRTRQTLVKAMRTTLVLSGGFVFVFGMNSSISLAGAVLYISGTSLGLYRGRSNLL